MSHPLLLQSSYIFDNSCTIDDIRQSYIDLHKETNLKEVSILLKRAILSFDNDIKPELANELFQLILACFSCFPKQFIPAFESLFKRSNDNSNYLICSVLVLSYLTRDAKCISITEYSSFVTDIISQLIQQIKISDNIDLTIYGHKIPLQFKFDLITNLLLFSNLTSEFVTFLFPQIFTEINDPFKKPRLDILMNNVFDAKLEKFLPNVILTNEEYLLSLNDEFIDRILPFLSTSIFNSLFPQIDPKFCKKKLNSNTALNYIMKCKESGQKTKSFSEIVQFLNPSDWTDELLNYVNEYDYKVPNEVVSRFFGIKDHELIFKIVSNPSFLPSDLLEEGLLHSTNIDFICRYLETRKETNSILYQKEFIKHVYSFFSECKTEKINLFTQIFVDFFSNDNLNDLFDEIIFSTYPPSMTHCQLLIKTFQSFSLKYKKIYMKSDHMNKMINEVLKREIIPSYSFMRLFSINDSYNYLVQNNLQNNVLMQLIVAFSSLSFSNSSIKQLDEITVFPPKSESSYQLLLQNLDSSDNNLLVGLNQESLSLISAAVIFLKSNCKLKVNGLTKDNIFQFFFLIFRFLNYMSFNDLFYPDNLIISKDNLDLFKEEFLYFSQNESMDIQKWFDLLIKDKHDDLIMQYFYEFNVQQIIDLFIDVIIDTGFSANKEYIVNLLANMKNDSILFIKCIINNLAPKDYASIQIKKKFKVYNLRELIKIITDNINENSAIDFILSNVLFMHYMYCGQFYLEVKNKKDLFASICKAIDEGIVNDVNMFKKIIFQNELSLSKYLEIFSHQTIKNLSKVHQETNFDELIKSVLECQSLETNDKLLETLFNYMLEDESNMLFYFIIFIEMCSERKEINANDFCYTFLDKYYKYGDLFIKSIDRVMIYDSKFDRFVFRAEYPIIEFQDLTISRFIKSIKEQSDNFNAFICLKSIMCTFPFLLVYPTEIMNEVFAVLDNYSLIFTENISNELKTAISALSFLLSSLNTNKFVDSFIEYAFNNISTFSHSQIFCLNVCLLSILQIPVIQKLLISKLFKYNFLEIVNSMIDRDIPEGKFKESFDCIIYFILNLYFSIIENFNKFNNLDLLMINEYEKIENLFSHYFDNHISTFPYQIKLNQTSLLKLLNVEIKNDEISSFILNVERVRPFWFSDTKITDINEGISTFIQKCKSEMKTPGEVINPSDIPFKFQQTNDAIVYLLKQKTWAFKWIVLNNTFHGFKEHSDYLKKVINDIPKENSNRFYRDEYLSKQIYNEKFIKKFILDEVLSKRLRKICFPDLMNFLIRLLKDQQTADFIISFMTDFLSNNGEIISAEQLIKVIQISSQLKKVKGINLWFDLILNISMKYPNRNNKSILFSISELLFQYPTLPSNVTQIVNFMFLNDDSQLFINALKLSSKFTTETVQKYLLLQNAFDTEIKKENPSLELINTFYSFAPEVFSTRSPELCDFLQTLFKKCQNESDFLFNDLLVDMIIKTINLISPKRNISCSFISNSKQDQFDVNGISNRIYELFPKFFDVFLLNRNCIDKIISSKGIELENFDLYKNFPELVDFQVRFAKFKKLVHSKIINSTERLRINPEFILADSFDHLGDASIITWKNSFRIVYLNENGVDMGGLKRDWFTKLAKELFDPKSEFFQFSGEKLCLQPNPLSIKYPNYKKYFVFAGRFVARTIMENICINVHLTRSFLKQILGHPLRMSDLDSIDENYRKSLEYILQNDFDEDDLEMYFEATDRLDKYKSYELIPNGSKIRITNQNKEEYVNLAMQYYLRNSMLEQIESFCKGFNSLIPHDEVKLFSPYQLNLIISGIPKIDINDFRENAHSSYDTDSKVFNMFFECISKWNDIELAKLLLFITGSSQVPPDGFKHFANSGHPITIVGTSDKSRLPVAHTCFNTIDLPPYDSLEIMDEKLKFAINECDGFLIA